MLNTANHLTKLVNTIMASNDIRQVIKYVSKDRTIKVTRSFYGTRSQKRKPNTKAAELRISDGAPNFHERDFMNRANKKFPFIEVRK